MHQRAVIEKSVFQCLSVCLSASVIIKYIIFDNHANRQTDRQTDRQTLEYWFLYHRPWVHVYAVLRCCQQIYRLRRNWKMKDHINNKSSAVAQKRRHAECALVYRHLWPRTRSTQPHAKIVVHASARPNAWRSFVTARCHQMGVLRHDAKNEQ